MTKIYRNLEDIAIKPVPNFNQLLKVLWRDGKPDYIPFYELFVDLAVMESVLGKKLPDMASTVEFYYNAGYDYMPVGPNFGKMKVGDLIDARRGYPITDRKTFADYLWPEPSSITFHGFDTVIPALPKGMKIIGQCGGVLEMAEQLCGYQGLCYLLADDRKLVGEIFDRIGQLYQVAYEGMSGLPEVGAVVISDDMGYKTQTLISPVDLREFVLPLHKRLAEIIHKHEKPCILHSCGNLVAIIKDLIEDVRIDAKHSYEDAVIPVTEARKMYGDRIAILGGFDVDRLCRDSEEEIRKHVDFLIDELGTAGGYALGSGNSIPEYMPVENYLVMLDEGWKRRR